MAISYVANGTLVQGTSATPSIPTGTTAGDFMVLVCADSGTTAISAPSGYTLITGISGGTNTETYTFYKVAGASESAPTVTLPSSSAYATIFTYRGVGGLDTKSTGASGSGTTLATNTLVTSSANEYILSIYSFASGTITATAPGSTTTRLNQSSSTGTTGFLVVDELQASAGTSTARTITISAGKTLTAQSFSLSPASGSNMFFMI